MKKSNTVKKKKHGDTITKEKKAALVMLIYNVILDENTSFSSCQLRRMAMDVFDMLQ